MPLKRTTGFSAWRVERAAYRLLDKMNEGRTEALIKGYARGKESYRSYCSLAETDPKIKENVKQNKALLDFWSGRLAASTTGSKAQKRALAEFMVAAHGNIPPFGGPMLYTEIEEGRLPVPESVDSFVRKVGGNEKAVQLLNEFIKRINQIERPLGKRVKKVDEKNLPQPVHVMEHTLLTTRVIASDVVRKLGGKITVEERESDLERLTDADKERIEPVFKSIFQPLVDRYMLKVREMQDLVRAHVVDLRPTLTSTYTDDWHQGRLFDSSYAARHEIDNWGIKTGDRYYNIGCSWVTVYSARFRRPSKGSALLQKMRRIHSELEGINGEINRKAENISAELEKVRNSFSEEEEKRYPALKKLEDACNARLRIIRFGFISPNFTRALIYRLEESLKKGKN